MLFLILELLEENDRDSFRSIYEKNYLKMYHVAYSRLQHPEDAENAVHDSFVKLAERYEKYRHLDTDKMTALCIVIAQNTSIDILRKRGHYSDRNIDDVLAEQEGHCDPEEDEKANFLERIQMLSEPLKQTLILKYYLELKNKEIAAVLNIPPASVEMRLYRARKLLREVLEDDR